MGKITHVIILFGVTRGIVNQRTTQRNTHNGAVGALASQTLVAAGQKRPIPTDISTFNRKEYGNGKPTETGPGNPKIQSLLDEIINDNGQDMYVTSLPSFAVKQNSSPRDEQFRRILIHFLQKINVATEAISGSYSRTISRERTAKTVVHVFPQAVESKPRRIEDIIG